MNKQIDLKQQWDLVTEYINILKPYIQRDGGDVELVKIEEGVVYVNLTGACVECQSLDVTLKDGLEKMLVENVEGIIAVKLNNGEKNGEN